jgi:peptidoglycan/xylan/chitin deacetylase (PgdA/CDA1 family)
MRKLVRALVLTLTLSMVPALAGAQTLQVSANDTVNDIVKAPENFISDIQNMPSAQIGAIVGGGLILGVVADTFLDGGIITVVGVVLGAAIGNHWYEHHYWPFSS